MSHTPYSRDLVPRLFSLSSAIVVFLVGSLVLLGWFFGSEDPAKSLLRGLAIAPNAAVGLILGSLALFILRIKKVNKTGTAAVRFIASVLILLGGAALFEFFSGYILPLNHVLSDIFPATAEGISKPWSRNMPPNTAIAFILYGFSLLGLKRFFQTSQVLLFLVSLIGGLALFRHAFGLAEVFGLARRVPFAGMSLYTAISLMILSFGTLANETSRGWVRIALEESNAGRLLRPVILAFVLAPFAFFATAILTKERSVEEQHLIFSTSSILLLLLFFVAFRSALESIIASDQTRDLAETQLRESEQLLQQIVNVLPVGLWIVDEKGMIVRGNDAGERIWGGRRLVSPEQFADYVGWWVETGERLGPEDWASYRALKFGETSIGELIRIQSFDGNQKIILNSAVPLRDERGIRGVVVVNEDITARYRVESQNRFLAAVSRELMEPIELSEAIDVMTKVAVPEIADWCAIYLLDEAGVLVFKSLRHVNPQSERMLRDALLAYPVSESTHGEIIQSIRFNRPTLISKVSADQMEKMILSPHLRDVLSRLSLKSYLIFPLKGRGRSIGAMALATGESGRVLDEADLSLAGDLVQRVGLAFDNRRLLAEARKAVREREDVLSMVSHDLKNPLSAISAFAQMQQKALRDFPHPPTVAKLADNILKSSATMEALIKSILDIGKIQAGTFSIEKRTLRLHSLFKQINDVFLPMTEEHEIRLQLPVAGDMTLCGDEARLFQVFSNLVGNALKFTPKGGEIRIGVVRDKSNFVFSVADTGIGIKPEDLPHLFDRYWQGKSADSRGSGLGLYIAKGIVEAHGGKIWVESVVQKGATFYFTVPTMEKSVFLHSL